jgi:aspartoacylase
MTPVKKVLIFGGTHGNEWTGVYAVNKRFKDEDLNRAFQFLNEDRKNSYEHTRAKELKTLINKEPCFLLDLHTTTSNMGNTVILSHENPLNLFVASKLVENLKDTRVILSPDPQRKYLASQSEFGMMIEVGPVANSIIEAQALDGTLVIMKEVLRTLSTPSSLTSGSVEIYEEIEDVFYPQNEHGEITSFIHKDFQGKDFVGICGEYTPFQGFSGEMKKMRTEETLYPIFINEAAYYPTKLAFTLCRKRDLSF